MFLHTTSHLLFTDLQFPYLGILCTGSSPYKMFLQMLLAESSVSLNAFLDLIALPAQYPVPPFTHGILDPSSPPPLAVPSSLLSPHLLCTQWTHRMPVPCIYFLRNFRASFFLPFFPSFFFFFFPCTTFL